MAERDRCQATHTAPTIPDGEPLTVQCDLPSGHVAQHESIDGGIIWGKPLSSVGGREPEPREGGFWVSSNQLSPADIAFARTRCGGWDWFVNESGLGWAFVPRLRASTPKGSEPCGRAVPEYHGETGECVRPAGHDGECYDGPVSPPSHDVEALREALDWLEGTVTEVRGDESAEAFGKAEGILFAVAYIRRSTHVGDEG